MEKEEWEDIPGYEGLYQASTHGRIRSYDKYVKCRGVGQRFMTGRVLKQFKDRYGYLRISLHKGGKIKTYKVHRLVLTVFDHPPKPGEQCNHKDGDKENIYIENLEWCTAKQNCDHRDNVLGKHNRGERQGSHVLTDRDVREIRVHLKEGKLTQK